MKEFAQYLNNIEDEQHRKKLEEILNWVAKTFPNLKTRIAWNQPMFTDHGTFIIAFSIARGHIAVAPEKAALDRFSEEIIKVGYEHSKMLIRMKWAQPTDYALLEKIIAFNIADKADYKAFWRKEEK